MGPCVAEDDLLELARGRPIGEVPGAEAHLADCPACSALVAALVEGDAEPGAAPVSLAGRTLGRYRLDAVIGSGGMGVVYRAWDARLTRHVAVKVLAANVGSDDSADRARRIAAEARAAAAIAHPNVVAVYDVGSHGDVGFVVQELAAGASVRSIIDAGPVPLVRAVRLGADLARGLAAAHACGVVHRDLKPENLVVTPDGTLKILDFGLARLHGEGDASHLAQGTPGYMAPEQVRGEPADARADIFAAGAILYELVTGRRAFDGAHAADRVAAVLRDPPPIAPATFGPLAPIVARCLAPHPPMRIQAAQDLAWMLEACEATPTSAAPDVRATTASPRFARRALLVGAAAASASAFAVGRFLRPQGDAATPPAFRPLTFRQGRVATARFTRDGGSVVFGAAWDASPLTAYALRLDGGPPRALDFPSADVLAVSSRNDLAISFGRRYARGQSATGRLATVPLDGGAPRMLEEGVQEADFTPDGRELAIVRAAGGAFRLELPLGAALVETDGWITHPRVSPDGRLVAFLHHPNVHDDRGDLRVVERATRRVRTLTGEWSSAAGLAWDPDGTALWLSAAREGANCEIHRITLDGHDRAVTRTTGRLRVHDVAGDRRIALSVDAWRLRTLVASLAASPGTERDASLSDFSQVEEISTDGRLLLVAEVDDVEGASAYLLPLDGGPPLRVGPGLPLATSPSAFRVAALVDGEPPTVVVYSTGSAERPKVSLGPLGHFGPARFIDERQLIVVAAEPGRPRRLWRITIGDAPPVPLTAEGSFGRCALDPPRRRAAYVDSEGGVVLLPLDTGAPRALPGLRPGDEACAWIDDGRAVVVRAPGAPIVLTRIDVESGAASPHATVTPPPAGLRGVDAFALRPDGTYAYSYGQELSQLYVMTLANAG